MTLLIAALVVAGAVYYAGLHIGGELRASRHEAVRGRQLALMEMFAAGRSAAQADPRALLIWQPLAGAARTLLPADFAELDRATGATFPFTAEAVQEAHARWTTEWLAWERSHDAEYKLKAALAEQELAASGASPPGRARLEAIDREKLDLYQRRYQEYVRVAKALQGMGN